MSSNSNTHYGNRLGGDHSGDAAYVPARVRFLLGVAPEPTLEGWGASPKRKHILDNVATALLRRAREEVA